MIIYKATDKSNGMVYIGQTINDLQERNRLRKYGTSKFDIEYGKKGENGFHWEIIDRATNIECLNKKEIYWIEYYNSADPNYGYNLTHGGKNFKHSEETKQKISIAQIGDKNHMYGKKYGKNGASKRIVDIVNGVVYESGTQVKHLLFNDVKDVDVCGTISKVCNGVTKNFMGYIFRFISDDGTINYFPSDEIKPGLNIKMYDGDVDIVKKNVATYAYNIITGEKVDIYDLAKRFCVEKSNILGSLRRNGISIRNMKLPVLKLREVWLHENDFLFFLDNKDSYDFSTNISKQSFIFNKYDLMEFRDASEAFEFYSNQGIRISKKSILDHLKTKSSFKFGVAKFFDMEYVY